MRSVTNTQKVPSSVSLIDLLMIMMIDYMYQFTTSRKCSLYYDEMK